MRFDQSVAEGVEALLLAGADLLLFEGLESSEHFFFDGVWQSSVGHWVEDLVFFSDVLAEQTGELSDRASDGAAILVVPSRRLLGESV